MFLIYIYFDFILNNVFNLNLFTKMFLIYVYFQNDFNLYLILKIFFILFLPSTKAMIPIIE